MSDITIDQIEILRLVDQTGSVVDAAKKLKRSHSSLLYSIGQLELALNQKVVDRTEYRLKISPFGRQVLQHGHKILEQRQKILDLSKQVGSGWPQSMSIVYDGFLDVQPILRAANHVSTISRRTQVSIYAEHLRGVRDLFEKERADAMLSVFEEQNIHGVGYDLKPIRSWLVCHKDYGAAERKMTDMELASWPFLIVKGTDERLELPTRDLDCQAIVQLGDFYAKKLAIMSGYGFGWLPEYLISQELKSKKLVPIRWNSDSRYLFKPRMYTNHLVAGSKAIELFVSKYLLLNKV